MRQLQPAHGMQMGDLAILRAFVRRDALPISPIEPGDAKRLHDAIPAHNALLWHGSHGSTRKLKLTLKVKSQVKQESKRQESVFKAPFETQIAFFIPLSFASHTALIPPSQIGL